MKQIVPGGREIGPAKLRHFFALHTAAFPTLIVMLMAFHFWRVRKAGGWWSRAPRPRSRMTRRSWSRPARIYFCGRLP